jgi:hypothetical protein
MNGGGERRRKGGNIDVQEEMFIRNTLGRTRGHSSVI